MNGENPRVVTFYRRLPKMECTTYDDRSGLRIGALATISTVAANELVREKYPALFQGAQSIASTHIQNRGTIIGNICNAVPSADSAPALLCLGATLVCLRKGGERAIELDQFLLGPNKTALQPGEVVKEIQVRLVSAGTGGANVKLSPRSR